MTNHGVKLATFGNTTKEARRIQGYIVAKRYRLGQITIPFLYGVFSRVISIFFKFVPLTSSYLFNTSDT